MTTGFSTEQIAATLIREGNMCAMECGRRATTANHRLNRKAGGRKGGSTMANACAICDLCNSAIEDNADVRAEAIRRGVKIEEGFDPACVLLWHPFYRQFVRLSDEALALTGVTDAGRDVLDLMCSSCSGIGLVGRAPDDGMTCPECDGYGFVE